MTKDEVSFSYAAPEVHKVLVEATSPRSPEEEEEGEFEVGPSSDVWSVGCIMYELAAHRKLYTASPDQFDPKRLLGATSVPEEAELMAQCLRRNPGERPCVDEALRHPYFAEIFLESDLVTRPLFVAPPQSEDPLTTDRDARRYLWEAAVRYNARNVSSST